MNGLLDLLHRRRHPAVAAVPFDIADFVIGPAPVAHAWSPTVYAARAAAAASSSGDPFGAWAFPSWALPSLSSLIGGGGNAPAAPASPSTSFVGFSGFSAAQAPAPTTFVAASPMTAAAPMTADAAAPVPAAPSSDPRYVGTIPGTDIPLYRDPYSASGTSVDPGFNMVYASGSNTPDVIARTVASGADTFVDPAPGPSQQTYAAAPAAPSPAPDAIARTVASGADTFSAPAPAPAPVAPRPGGKMIAA